MYYVFLFRRYFLIQIHDCVLYLSKKEPLLRNYFTLLCYLKLKMKEENEEEFPNYCERINEYVSKELNLPKIYPKTDSYSDVAKTLIKEAIVSNCGSLTSRSKSTSFQFCSSYDDFMKFHEENRLLDFYDISDRLLCCILRNIPNRFSKDVNHNPILYR